jgi:hypothetical protein
MSLMKIAVEPRGRNLQNILRNTYDHSLRSVLRMSNLETDFWVGFT